MPPRPDDSAKPPLTTFGTVSDEEVLRVNRLQQDLFDELYHLFEPPLPAGVPERLEKMETFIDEPGLYILVCTKSRFGGGERPESER